MSDSEALWEFFHRLAMNQEPLGEPFASILQEHLDALLIRTDPPSSPQEETEV